MRSSASATRAAEIAVRGDSAYDRYYRDPLVRPNPNLGTIEKGPFEAVRIVPGDLGTKGGVMTDAASRAAERGRVRGRVRGIRRRRSAAGADRQRDVQAPRLSG